MFVPFDVHRKHAIREAIFGLQLASAPKPEDVKRFVDLGKKNWQSDLPSHGDFQLTPLLPFPPPANIAVGLTSGASFQAFKKDGSLSWRVLVQDKVLVVNCLEYEGWQTVWPRACEYLSVASAALLSSGNSIAGATLQYINGFPWDASANQYDVTSLLRADADLIPAAFWKNRGAEWHLHQGWYDSVQEPLPGRILNRDHLTSQIEEVQGKRTPTVLLDLLRRYDFTVRDSSSKNFFNQRATAVFKSMRILVRRALRAYLRDDILEQIQAVALE